MVTRKAVCQFRLTVACSELPLVREFARFLILPACRLVIATEQTGSVCYDLVQRPVSGRCAICKWSQKEVFGFRKEFEALRRDKALHLKRECRG